MLVVVEHLSNTSRRFSCCLEATYTIYCEGMLLLPLATVTVRPVFIISFASNYPRWLWKWLLEGNRQDRTVVLAAAMAKLFPLKPYFNFASWKFSVRKVMMFPTSGQTRQQTILHVWKDHSTQEHFQWKLWAMVQRSLLLSSAEWHRLTSTSLDDGWRRCSLMVTDGDWPDQPGLTWAHSTSCQHIAVQSDSVPQRVEQIFAKLEKMIQLQLSWSWNLYVLKQGAVVVAESKNQPAHAPTSLFHNSLMWSGRFQDPFLMLHKTWKYTYT